MQSFEETVFYKCPDDDFCLGESRLSDGEPEAQASLQINCKEGHTGIMCSECLPGYSMQLGACTLCGTALENTNSNEDTNSAGAGVRGFDSS